MKIVFVGFVDAEGHPRIIECENGQLRYLGTGQHLNPWRIVWSWGDTTFSSRALAQILLLVCAPGEATPQRMVADFCAEIVATLARPCFTLPADTVRAWRDHWLFAASLRDDAAHPLPGEDLG